MAFRNESNRRFRHEAVWFGLASMLATGVLAVSGCDRNIEPFDPNEVPVAPDLSRIFPAGAGLAEREAPAGLPPSPNPLGGRGAPPVAPRPDATAAPPIQGSIRLADGIAPPPGAVLFLIARVGEGGPPLAVRRIADPSFPLDFRLGPEDRMLMSIPFRGPLRITARVDSDGNATSRTPGDLEGAAPGTYEPGARGVDVVIDEVL